jgi:glycosyltransferase involved in cell wall biosynthesis
MAGRPASQAKQTQLHFVMNGVFNVSVAGGDLHCLELARAALKAGYSIRFWGGHALQEVLAEQKVPADLTLTDHARLGPADFQALPGQFKLFTDYFRRFAGTLRQRAQMKAGDIVYAVSDYWSDVLPVVWSRAERKLMIWHMQAPSLGQIIRRSRPDVDPARLASLHYWLSQNISLRSFRFCRNKRLFYVHPAMRERLLAMGYRETEIQYLSFGMEAEPPPGSEVAQKTYDACWIGRVHRQKGIEDLLATLSFLAKNVDGFRAVMIGNVKAGLAPRIKELDLERHVEFSGFVSETEKFRLFRASRIFLMPSRFEGSPRVVGEALLCGLPVVAYEVETYRAIFRDLIHYVPCFDLAAFQNEALKHIRAVRAGAGAPPESEVKSFIRENSWQVLRERFLKTLSDWQ